MDFNKLNLAGYSYENGMIKNGEKIISRQLIYPSKIIQNIEEGTYKVELKFVENKKENTLIVDMETISSKNKIISLANFGVWVNSSNANSLINYLNNIIVANPLEREKSVSHLGFVKNEFIPYSKNIVFDGELSFKDSYTAIAEPKGSFEEWKKKIEQVRKNKVARLIIDASFTSPLLEYTSSLPFVVLVWGGTGLGKTVALKVAASIWGNPDGSALINNLDSTTNFIYRTMAFYHNLPCFFDELQVFAGNKNKLIMTITQGIDRGKANKVKGNERKETWKNCAIFTGEDSLSSSNSGGGTLNRLIEIYINSPVVDNCMDVVDFVKENYGFAGREFINFMLEKGKDFIKSLYKEKYNEILKLGKTADKQAASMANILTADHLLSLFMFNETPLTVEEIKDFLLSKEEIDISERAYDYFVDEVLKNLSYFVKKDENDLSNESVEGKREFWGNIDGYEIMILKSQLEKMLNNASFNPTKTMKEWADKGYLIRNSQGRYAHQTSVSGISGNFIKIRKINRQKQKEQTEKNQNDKQKTVTYINSYQSQRYGVQDVFWNMNNN